MCRPSVIKAETHTFEVFLHDVLHRKRSPAAEHRDVPHGGSGHHDGRGARRRPEVLDVAVCLHQVQRAAAAGRMDQT